MTQSKSSIMNEVAHQIIIDSSFLVAEIDSSDFFHEKACAMSKRLQQASLRPILLDIVVNETLTVLGKRFERKQKMSEFDLLFSAISPLFSKEKILFTGSLIQRSWVDILKIIQSSSGRLSFHDSLIAIVMQEYAIRKIATFDQDFKLFQKIEIFSEP